MKQISRLYDSNYLRFHGGTPANVANPANVRPDVSRISKLLDAAPYLGEHTPLPNDRRAPDPHHLSQFWRFKGLG
jgi:hypothetical protein